MLLALVGNQNCGKTTLFNQLTGSNQHVGNFPGVTIEHKIGQIIGWKNYDLVDLPGIYSIRPYSGEEKVSRDFIIERKPDAIINIVDATNIERNLYLTLQLIEMGKPMVLALNMMDELLGNHGSVDIQKLSDRLGIPVVPIAAAKNDGVDELMRVVAETAENTVKPRRIDFCSAGPVHRCIHTVSHVVEDHADKIGVPSRFAATRVIEEDAEIISALKLSDNELELIGHAVLEMENEGGLDRNAALAEMRYRFIEAVCSECVIKAQESKEMLRSVKIDKVLTNKYLAIPMFIAIMGFIFWMTFSVLGKWLSDLLALGIDEVTALVDNALTAYGLNPVVHSLVIDGVFAGVGSMLSFLPIIVVLFFFLAILEDTGYMSRVAFVMDKLLRRIGLSGRSFVPMLIGFGCSVPAIMATRTLLVRARPQDDDAAHSVYELLCEDTYLCRVHGGVLPGSRRPCHDLPVCFRHARGHNSGKGAQQNGVHRQARAVCHGASELPHAVAQKRSAAHVGKGVGLHPPRVHRHFRGDHCHMVFAALRRAPQRCRRGQHRQSACHHRHMDSACVRAPRLWRLARCNGTPYRPHGKGSRHKHARRFDERRRKPRLGRAGRTVHSALGRELPCVLPAVHALRGGSGGAQARAWQRSENGARHDLAVLRGMAGGLLRVCAYWGDFLKWRLL